MSAFLKNTSIVFILLLSSKVFAFLRDTFLVGKLGANIETDMFYGILNIVEVLILFSGLNAMKSVATTTFTKEKMEKDSTSEYFSSLIYFIIFWGAIVCLPVILVPKTITNIFLPGFDDPVILRTAYYLRIVAILIMLRGTFLVFGNLFGVKKKFICQNVFMPLINLCGVVIIIFSPPDIVVRNLCYIMVAAYGMSVIFQYFLLQEQRAHLIYVPLGKIVGYSKKFITVGTPLLLVTTTFALSTSTDKIIGSFFKEGTITSLNLANIICFMPLQLILIPISNVLFPHFSSLYFNNKIDELEKVFNKGQLIVIILFIPITLFIVFFNKEIVLAAFYRNNFSMENINTVSLYLMAYGFALLFNAFYYLTSFLFQSAQKNNIIGKVGFTGFLVNIVCSISISYALKNPIGIPIGTLCAFIVFCVMANLYVKSEFGIKLSTELLWYSIKFLLLSVTSGIIVSLIPLTISLGSEFNTINCFLNLISKAALYFTIVLIIGYPIVKSKISELKNN